MLCMRGQITTKSPHGTFRDGEGAYFTQFFRFQNSKSTFLPGLVAKILRDQVAIGEDQQTIVCAIQRQLTFSYYLAFRRQAMYIIPIDHVQVTIGMGDNSAAPKVTPTGQVRRSGQSFKRGGMHAFQPPRVVLICSPLWWKFS